MRKPTLGEMRAMLADYAKLNETHRLDFEPWRRAHPELQAYHKKSGGDYTFTTKPARDEPDQRFYVAQHDEPQHDFSKRFRDR